MNDNVASTMGIAREFIRCQARPIGFNPNLRPNIHRQKNVTSHYNGNHRPGALEKALMKRARKTQTRRYYAIMAMVRTP